MGLFNKIKNMFKNNKEEEIDLQEETIVEEQEIDEEDISSLETSDESNVEKEEIIEEKINHKITDKKEKKHKKEQKSKNNVKIYEKGLTKSREGFVSKLANLTNKYNKVNEEYFEELEEILIMADIGINTVMEFMDRLRTRVRNEKLEDPEILKEVIIELINKGKYIIMSSHQMSTIEQFCTDLIILDKGKTILQGNLNEIRDSYDANRLEIESCKNIDSIIKEAGLNVIFSKDNYYEIEICNHEEGYKLFELIAKSNIKLNKFELKRPSLHDIFIEKVGASK